MACVLLQFQKCACIKSSMLCHILGNSYFFPQLSQGSKQLKSHISTQMNTSSISELKKNLSYFHHICLISIMSCFYQF